MKSKEDFTKIFKEAMRNQELKFLAQYNESIVKIKDLLLNYSEKDIIYSLFSVSLWLRNVASPVKLKLVYMILCSIKPYKLQKEEKINNYKDYSEFVNKLILLFPDFYMLEDYIPEADWGEIKFYHNQINCKIFYGCDIDGVYEFLESFQLIHCSLNDVYLKVCDKSPIIELEQSLILQQRIIENVKFNCSSEETEDIPLGNLEIPSENFWKSCVNFYDSFDSFEIPNEFLITYSCNVGEIDELYLESNNFIKSYFYDETFLYLFIKAGKRYYPILPRRYVSIMIESWGIIYHRNIDEIKKIEPNLNNIFNLKLYSFVNKRTMEKNFFKLISPFDKEKNSPGKSIYSCAFISKNELYLLYLMEPSYDENQIEEKLKVAIQNIEEDLEILSQSPMTILLNTEKKVKVIGFNKEADVSTLKPKVLIVIPRLRISLSILKPKKANSIIITLEDLLGIMDELKNFEEISEFFKFIIDPKIDLSPFNSMLDFFGAFRESFKVLNPGANASTSFSIAPLWGASYRFESLRKFWNIYPEINFTGDPRIWKVNKDRNVVRLESKKDFMLVLYVKVGESNIFINAPFNYLSFEQGRITNLLMETIEDGLIMYNDFINSHSIFKKFKKIQIFVFPFEAVEENLELSYLIKSDPEEKLFFIEHGFTEQGILAIRVSFNYQRIFEGFKLSKDRVFEINLIKEIIFKLNEINPEDITYIIDIIEKDSSKPPRFKINEFKKLASFPEFAKVVEPEPSNFKSAKKCIAEVALNNSINPGEYNLDEGKEILNRLKESLVKLINNKVIVFNFSSSINYLISKTDALTNKYEYNRLVYEKSIDHDVDYRREEKYSTNHLEYIKSHRNFRYLIEKFVQLSPIGDQHFKEVDLKEMLGLIDWLHVLQYASDSIHYLNSAVGITVKKDFQVDVIYTEDYESMEKLFSEEEAKLNLKIKGNSNDIISSKIDNIKYIDDLDKAFILDFKFSLKNLITVLEVLTYWSVHIKSKRECEFYQANLQTLFEVTIGALTSVSIDKDEFINIIDFLTLFKDEILHVMGNSEPCIDLPIWEHNKRPMRYNLKPLIKISDDYIWGPFSAKKTSEVWKGNISGATFPFDFQTMSVKKVLEKERESISNILNIKTEEIIKRHTNFVKMKCEIFKIDRNNPELRVLGDFDVLGFLPDKSILLNVECKDLQPPFCLKDTKTLRERLFGKDSTEHGYFEKVINRESYLKENTEQILNKLNWIFNKKIELKILTLFITRRNYWWTKFPPFKTDVKFLRIDLLDDYLKNLK